MGLDFRITPLINMSGTKPFAVLRLGVYQVPYTIEGISVSWVCMSVVSQMYFGFMVLHATDMPTIVVSQLR